MFQYLTGLFVPLIYPAKMAIKTSFRVAQHKRLGHIYGYKHTGCIFLMSPIQKNNNMKCDRNSNMPKMAKWAEQVKRAL